MTGTFDDWGKTIRLDRKGDVFEKEVPLPATEEKLHYKVRDIFSLLTSMEHYSYYCIHFPLISSFPLPARLGKGMM